MNILEGLRNQFPACKFYYGEYIFPDLLRRENSFRAKPELLLQKGVVWNLVISSASHSYRVACSFVNEMSFLNSTVKEENADLISAILDAQLKFPDDPEIKGFVLPAPRYEDADDSLPENMEEAREAILKAYPEADVCKLLLPWFFTNDTSESEGKHVYEPFHHSRNLNHHGLTIAAKFRNKRNKFTAAYYFARNRLLYGDSSYSLEHLADSLVNGDFDETNLYQDLLTQLDKSRVPAHYNFAIISDYPALGAALKPIGEYLSGRIEINRKASEASEAEQRELLRIQLIEKIKKLQEREPSVSSNPISS